MWHRSLASDGYDDDDDDADEYDFNDDNDDDDNDDDDDDDGGGDDNAPFSRSSSARHLAVAPIVMHFRWQARCSIV